MHASVGLQDLTQMLEEQGLGSMKAGKIGRSAGSFVQID